MNHTAFKKYSPVFWNNLVINKQVLNKHLNFICKNQDFAYQCNPRLIPGWEEEAGFICIRKKFGAWLVYIGLFLWRCKNTPCGVSVKTFLFCFLHLLCPNGAIQQWNLNLFLLVSYFWNGASVVCMYCTACSRAVQELALSGFGLKGWGQV